MAAGTSVCAQGSRSRAVRSELTPVPREAGGVAAQSWVMKHEGLAYAVTANESCAQHLPCHLHLRSAKGVCP